LEAPLPECTSSEQRAVIRFLWAEGIKPSEIHRRMLVQYVISVLDKEKFVNGQKGLKMEERMSLVTTDRAADLALGYQWTYFGTLYGTWTYC
jgi:hypothetical protein